MAEAQKFHIGANGPAPCGAKKRACRYASTDGTEAEVWARWENQMQREHGDVAGAPVSKTTQPTLTERAASPLIEADYSAATLPPENSLISVRSSYEPKDKGRASYTEEEKDVAMRLALSEISPLSSTPLERVDTAFNPSGFSDVKRAVLTDGTAGYFKSFAANSRQEFVFKDYGTTSIGASINEVNAYRMAQAMGPGFDRLVPETAFRELDGELGTFQREVKERVPDHVSFSEVDASEFMEDQRRAAIFDFVVGSQDRQGGNFIASIEEKPEGGYRKGMSLIDNSFSFPPDESTMVNGSYFTSKFTQDHSLNEDRVLQEADHHALNRAEEAAMDWEREGTMSEESARGVLARIEKLRTVGKILDFESYSWNLGSEDGNSFYDDWDDD